MDEKDIYKDEELAELDLTDDMPHSKLIDVNIEKEMKKSFLDYSMSVIVSRALPDVRDGLKPVHRRILYAMYEDGLTSDKPYRKSATTVGNVLGRYHPHGDASVYDAMVRMAQPFSLHYPLIDGHGNFGSVDGDPPAAYRYTEARMARLANYMLADIKKNTVDFQPNFDEERQERSTISVFARTLILPRPVAAGGKLQPRVLTLRQILDQYIGFQKDVVERRTRFDLKKARDRAHILEGLKVATDNIDRIIAIIRASKNEAEAKENLMAEPFWIDQIALLGIVDGSEHFEFHLDEPQAQAIVDMRLGRLSGLEQEKINDEYKDLESRIAGFEDILSCDANILAVVKQELQEIKQKYGDERHTQIENVADEIDIEDLIEQQDCAYTLTHFGYIKRQPTSVYRAQRRGGRGVSAMSTREEDFAKDIFTASTHDTILFFSDRGKVYKLKGYQIPETGRSAKGMNIVNLLELENGEKITAMFPIQEFADDKFLFFVTRQGIAKRIVLSDLQNIRRAGLRALSLNEDDALVDVRLTDGEQNILIATHNGKAICFDENEVRAMGRTATGVRGIKLADGDYVIGAARARKDAYVLSVTENGYGKRTPVEEFSVHHRGGGGIMLHSLTAKTGLVAGIAVVDSENDVMIITDDGVIIRTGVEEIRECGRGSQGVIVMRTGADVKVISIARTDKEEEDETAEESADESAETGDETTDGE